MKTFFAKILSSFQAQSAAVKALIAVLGVTVVATAGVGIYVAADHSSKPKQQTVADASASSAQESSEAKQEIAEAVTEESVESEEASEVQETQEEVTEGEEIVYFTPYVKTSDKLINGDFADGLNGFDLNAYAGAVMDYSIDSKNGLAITIADTGTEDWNVQLKQGDIRLTKGKWYKLTLDAKSDRARTVICAMQKDGTNDNDWTPYSQSTRLNLNSKWQTFTLIFKMDAATDPKALFNLSLGTVDGVRITKEHTVNVRNIKLTTLEDSWTDSLRKGDNLIANHDFSYKDILWEGSVIAPGAAKVSFDNNKAVFDISKPGEKDWNVQLKQSGIALEQGCGYRLTFKASSSVERIIKIGFMDTEYVNWYGGGDVVIGPSETVVTSTFYMDKATNPNAIFMLSIGQIEGAATPASVITFSDFQLVKAADVTPSTVQAGGGSSPFISLNDGWVVYDHERKHVGKCYVDGENGFKIEVNNTGSEEWHVQLQKKFITLENGKYYKVSFEAKSTVDRVMNYMLQKDGSADNNWMTYSLTDGSAKPTLQKEWQSFGQTFKMSAETNNAVQFTMSFGKVNGTSVEPHTVWVRNIVLEEVEAPAEQEIGCNEEIFNNTEFADNGSGWEINCPADKGTVTMDNGSITYDIADVGTNEWDHQLKQSGLKLEKGCKYRASFRVNSEVDRMVKYGFLSTSYDWYGGGEINLTAGADTPVTFEFVMEKETDTNAFMQITMGQMYSDLAYTQKLDTPAGKITLSNFSLMKIESADESGKLVIKATDEKVTDNGTDYKWVKKFEPADYCDGYQSGDKIKITAKLSSDGVFTGFLGMCYNLDYSGWINSDMEEVTTGNTVWEMTVDKSMGAIQLQIFYMGGESVAIDEFTVEKVSDEAEDPTPEDPEALMSGIVNKATGNVGFNYSDYVSEVNIGDKVAITVKLSSSLDSFGGGLGAVDNGEGGWKQVQYDNANSTVTLEVEAGKNEAGELNTYTEIQAWWPEEGDISYELVSVTVTPATAPDPTPAEPTALMSGIVNKATGNVGFNYGDYVSEVNIGDKVAITVKLSSSLDSFGGGLGAVDNGEGGWKQVQYDKANSTVTLEVEAGKNEAGELNTYAEIQAWWPEEGDISYELVSVTKQ